LQLGDKVEAKRCYASTLRLAGTKAEKAFLASRLKELDEF
jgi:predicted RNA polymerase sigma factor